MKRSPSVPLSHSNSFETLMLLRPWIVGNCDMPLQVPLT